MQNLLTFILGAFICAYTISGKLSEQIYIKGATSEIFIFIIGLMLFIFGAAGLKIKKYE